MNYERTQNMKLLVCELEMVPVLKVEFMLSGYIEGLTDLQLMELSNNDINKYAV